MAISPEQFKNTVAPFLGIKIDKSLGQKALDQLINSNPALAAKMGAYNKVLDGAVSGNPVLRVAKGGYIFAADELSDPQVKEEMKDNPEFSEFSVDQQNATANKMQQRFAQPEDKMRPARGFAVGGQPQIAIDETGNQPVRDPNNQPFMGRPAFNFPRGFPDEGGGNNNFEVATDMRDSSMGGNLIADQGGPQDLRFRATPNQITDMADRRQMPIDPNVIIDPLRRNDGSPVNLYRPPQQDSKIARADTRRFGEQQPQLFNRMPYRGELPGGQLPPASTMPMIPGGPGGDVIDLNQAQVNRPAQPTSMTYELARSRASQRDVKSPQEQAIIDAALALGPGGVYNIPPASDKAPAQTDLNKLADAQKDIMMKTYTDPGSVITAGVTENIVPSDYNEIAAGTGQVTGDPSVDLPTATDVATTDVPTAEGPAGVMTATTAADKVKAATDAMTAKTGAVGDDAQVTAATEDKSAVSDLTAAAGVANVMTNPVKRKIEAGEIVSGAADAATAAAFTEQVEAATATPSDKATVKGQLDTLMNDFDGGETPVWAAGAMRAANAAMAARGLGASSMAGQAIIQAAMESAIPIAQADASTTAQFEMQNLSNRQQRAMLAAQQRATFIGQEFDQEFQSRVANSARIGDIANMNFTADQQIALENGRAANTMNMANLSNSQAMVMAEAAALSQLDISNLNNRQQAAVQNAQNFMQMDMQNLSNEQQTSMFKQQQVVASLFTDQAAENAASQLNATSENQTQQFFASLASQTSQFNATQTNAMSQFDADNVSTLKRFNAELDNQRDQFNATNGLAIAQSNAQWRQNATTLNTAAANEANMEYAKTVNGLTGTALDQLWQRERDLMSFAFTGSESAADRAVKIAVAKLTGEQQADLADQMGKGSFFSTILTGILGSKKVFGFGSE